MITGNGHKWTYSHNICKSFQKKATKMLINIVKNLKLQHTSYMCQKFRKTLIRVSRESYLPSSEIDSDILDHLREYTYLVIQQQVYEGIFQCIIHGWIISSIVLVRLQSKDHRATRHSLLLMINPIRWIFNLTKKKSFLILDLINLVGVCMLCLKRRKT